MRYRDRRRATQYLRESGFPCGDSFLAQQAITGKGPPFRYSGRYPVYTESDLDEWMEARLSLPVRSLSEAAVPLLNTDSNPPLSPPTRTARRRSSRPPKNKAVEPDEADMTAAPPD